MKKHTSDGERAISLLLGGMVWIGYGAIIMSGVLLAYNGNPLLGIILILAGAWLAGFVLKASNLS